MKYWYLFLICATLCVSAAEKVERKIVFTPYTIANELNGRTKHELQKQYQDYRNHMISKFALGLRVSGLMAFGFGAVSVARYYTIIDQNLALYRAFPGFSLISLAASTFYYQKRNFWINLPTSLNEQQIQDAFEEGKKNANKHIQQICKLQ